MIRHISMIHYILVLLTQAIRIFTLVKIQVTGMEIIGIGILAMKLKDIRVMLVLIHLSKNMIQDIHTKFRLIVRMKD